MNVHIRVAASHDREDIHDIYLRAFPEGEGLLIAALAGDLLSETSDPPTLNLVAETGDEVVGHVAFSPVYSGPDKKWLGYILAPLAVKPGHQDIGIGSKLVDGGMARLAEKGVNLLLVYGDPAYYGRFGFGAQTAAGFLPPYELKYPFGWLAVMLDHDVAHEQAVQLSCVAALRNRALW